MDDNNIDDTLTDELKSENRKQDSAIKRKAKKEAKKHAKNASKKFAKKASATMFRSVGISVFSSILSIFIIIFMLIGIVSFIVTMPGLVQDGIINAVNEFITKIGTAVNGSDNYLEELAEEKNKQARIDILNYLSDMGLDPVGFGFAPFYNKSNGGSYDTDILPKEYAEISDGFISGFIDAFKYNEALKEKTKKEDLIYKYLVSNERAFLIHDGDKIGTKVKDFFNSDVSLYGMIRTAIKGLDDSTITVDRQNKSMIIKSTNMSELAKQTVEYNLESWTGRYGTSLEMLLALHIGTMSADLTEELITNPNLTTQVNIISEKADYDLDFEVTYKGKALPFRFGVNDYEGADLAQELSSKLTIDNNGNVNIEGEIETDITVRALYKYISDNLYSNTFKKYNENVTLEAVNALLSDSDFYAVSRYSYPSDQIMNDSNPGEKMLSRFSSYWGYAKKRENDYILDENSVMNKYLKYEDADHNTDGDISGLVMSVGEDGLPVYILRREDNAKKANGMDFYDEKTIETIAKNDAMSQYVPIAHIVHGFEYYKQHPQELLNENDINPIIGVLSQLDAYLYMEGYHNTSEGHFTMSSMPGDSYSSIQCFVPAMRQNINGTLIKEDIQENKYELRLFLTRQFIDMFYNHDENYTNFTLKNLTNQQIKDNLDKIEESISTHFNNVKNKEDLVDKILKKIFEKKGYDLEISYGDIEAIYNAMHETDKEVEFVWPRIKNVVKHWYKDIVFEGVNKNFKKVSVYSNTTKDLKIDYKSDNEDLKITAVLSPKNDGWAEQKEQPYVIKGDIVTLDGEVVTDSGLEGSLPSDYAGNEIKGINEDGEEKDYVYGDGYRTAKKLFTEGKYYVFDGSKETSRSIFYAKEIEKCDKNNYARVIVQSGTIRSFVKATENDLVKENKYNSETGKWIGTTEVSEGISASSVGKSVIEAEDGSWSVFHAAATISGTLARSDIYYIKFNSSMEYLSPGRNSVEKTEESVKRINSLLDAMGVVTQRKEVSFDNTTTNGDITSLTAFSILEGMKTISAQYVYRDLKEFLIELGYYTKAEFDYLSTNVLNWFIPEYKPVGKDKNFSWPLKKDEDSLLYGAILYPADENDKDNETTGFEEGLEVVAPGNCRIIGCEDNKITLRFDGESQPEISMLNNYTMIIVGANVSKDDVITVLNNDQTTEVQMTIAQAIEGKNIVKMGTKIAETGTEKIQVILKNNLGALLHNVEDYMAPKTAVVSSETQEYQFTEDEIVLLAYIINHEGAPEGMAQYMPDNSVYASKEDAAMAFSEAIGYVLINRALENYGGHGTTIEAQALAPGQYDGSFTIQYAKEHEAEISVGSMEAAVHCATYDCGSITNPDGVQMTRDVVGESAWTFGHKVFWWVDVNKNGKQDIYAESMSSATTEHPYPVGVGEGNGTTLQEWPWDVYLTYSN